jgi:hypothetical protein
LHRSVCMATSQKMIWPLAYTVGAASVSWATCNLKERLSKWNVMFYLYLTWKLSAFPQTHCDWQTSCNLYGVDITVLIYNICLNRVEFFCLSELFLLYFCYYIMLAFIWYNILVLNCLTLPCGILFIKHFWIISVNHLFFTNILFIVLLLQSSTLLLLNIFSATGTKTNECQ